MTFYLTCLRPPNKKIWDISAILVHGLTTHAKFQSHRLKTVGISEGQSLPWITSTELIWLLDLA